MTPARVPEPQPSPQILHVPAHSPASHHPLQKKSDKTMMSPFLLLFLLSQTLVYVSLFIFSTPSLTLATKAHCLHTLSPFPVISWSSWCSLPWGPCPNPLHSHPLPPAQPWHSHRALGECWALDSCHQPLCKHQLSSDTKLMLQTFCWYPNSHLPNLSQWSPDIEIEQSCFSLSSALLLDVGFISEFGSEHFLFLLFYTLSESQHFPLQQTKMVVLVNPNLLQTPLVSQLKQLKMTFSLAISNISLRALQHQVLFFIFFLSLPNLTRFLFSLQRPFTAASSHLSLSFWRLTLTRHSISSQTSISVQCLILQFSSQILFYLSPPSSVPMVPTQPGRVQRAVWRGGRGKRELAKFWEAWKMCREASNTCVCLWAPTCCLTDPSVEQEQPLGCCACRVLPRTPLLLYSPQAALLASLSSKAKLQNFGWPCLLILVLFLWLLALYGSQLVSTGSNGLLLNFPLIHCSQLICLYLLLLRPCQNVFQKQNTSLTK